MAPQIVLAAVVILMSVAGLWLLRAPVINPGAPISSKARTGYWYAALTLIVLGAVNLFFGFRDGEMFWVTKAYKGWLPYEGYEWAFIFLGAMSGLSVTFGFVVIKLFALSRRRES